MDGLWREREREEGEDGMQMANWRGGICLQQECCRWQKVRSWAWQTQNMFPKMSGRVVMLTQFPVGFSNTCSSSEIETVISASLYCKGTTQSSAGAKGHPCPEEALVARLVFWVMALFFPSQEIWMGTLSQGARNLNVVVEVTLP